jgi:hypothetical protein
MESKTLVTEDNWMSCEAPLEMFRAIGGKASERKCRLFACACFHRLTSAWGIPAEPIELRAVEVAERSADGSAGYEARRAVLTALAEARLVRVSPAWAATRSGRFLIASNASELTQGIVSHLTDVKAWGETRLRESYYRRQPLTREGQAAAAAEARAQTQLVRELFGNPFRPPVIEPNWLAWNGEIVSRLARAIYEERHFADMPILADALEEAGCANEDILGHCRRPGEHVRGCWVLDAILAKE